MSKKIIVSTIVGIVLLMVGGAAVYSMTCNDYYDSRAAYVFGVPSCAFNGPGCRECVDGGGVDYCVATFGEVPICWFPDQKDV